MRPPSAWSARCSPVQSSRAVSEGVGFRLRRTLILPGLGALDGLLGAALGAVVGLGIVWIAAAVAAQSQGQIALR